MGIPAHDLRLGAKGGKINVLSRRAGKVTEVRTAFAAAAMAVVFICSSVESSYADETPLHHCWRQASSRIELKPCLERWLRDAEEQLKEAQRKVEMVATELDRVTGDRSKNVELARASDTRWRAYRDAECDRQAEAMSPGTGMGDMYLACRITLTDERVRHLGMP